MAHNGFNPHPVVGPDATRQRMEYQWPITVSILTRSSDRMQPEARNSGRKSSRFQSSPVID